MALQPLPARSDDSLEIIEPRPGKGPLELDTAV
jgi:hypothetical protein